VANPLTVATMIAGDNANLNDQVATSARNHWAGFGGMKE
jgi:hypothetical protein